jgi:hypothetical protein
MNAARAILTSAGLSLVLSAPVACSHEETTPESSATLTQATYPPPGATENAPPGLPESAPPGVTGNALPPATGNAPAPPPPAPGTRGELAANARDPIHALFAAASNLALPSSQHSAVEAIHDEIRADREQVKDSFTPLHQDLAGQVRAGAIDATGLQGDATTVVAAMDSHYNKEVNALNQLHAALDASQRVAAGEAARGRLAAASSVRATIDERAWRLGRLTDQLGLDATQQQQVSTLLGSQPQTNSSERAQRQSMAQQLISAFEADSFDATSALPAASWSPGAKVRAEIDRRASFLSQLLPILRPEQRERLAAQLDREGPDLPNED